MELFKALFIVGLAKSILTSEILLELENLQDFSLIVEVTNLNIDCAKCSYFWNQSNNTDVLFKDVLIRYRYSGIGGFSNETYWKLWETARNDEKIARLENTHWAGFNVFILHSEQFPLYQPFYLQEDLCHDFFPVSTTSNDVITIKSHPLENINIHTIHRVFAQTYQLYRLETHKVFEYIRNYLEVFNKIKNSLGPITVKSK